jgi:hypothetical protein
MRPSDSLGADSLGALPAVERASTARSLSRRVRVVLVQFGLLGSLAGCMGFPVQQTSVTSVPAPTAPGRAVAATQVFVYPSHAQSAQQLDRDRYECHLWAVEQTRFDPSQQALAPHQRTEVVAMPPAGSEAAAGAIAGAAIGAIVSRPSHAAAGAIVGAVIGGLTGASAEAERSNRAEELGRLSDEKASAQLERQSNDYRRALSACLEGRGYTVK